MSPTVRAIEPLSRPPDTTVTVPGSKSITNRAILCAGLADGRSVLEGALWADDTEAMADAVGAMGATCELDPDSGDLVIDGGGGVASSATGSTVDCRMSGTTARFVTPVLSTASRPALIDGHPQLRSRPMKDLVDALRSAGVEVEARAETGHLPLRVTGPVRARSVELPGDVSSQFVSGLLMAAPLTESGLTVSLTTEVVSRPYVEMTVGVMRSFGARVHDEGGASWRVEPGGYHPADRYRIEPDASSASYFLAAAAVTGGRVEIAGLSRSSLQGDVGFADVLAQVGARPRWTHGSLEVTGDRLTGGSIDLRDLSDTAPTLAVVAALCEGPTEVTGIGFIRGKESDRIAGSVAELNRCGVPATETADGFVVRPDGPPRAARFHTYDDHRMAMAFSVLGLVVPGVEIEDPDVVAKTFPDFYEVLDRLR